MRNLFNKSDWQWIMVCGLITAMCLGENHFEKKMINKQYQYVINNKDSVISHQNNTFLPINRKYFYFFCNNQNGLIFAPII